MHTVVFKPNCLDNFLDQIDMPVKKHLRAKTNRLRNVAPKKAKKMQHLQMHATSHDSSIYQGKFSYNNSHNHPILKLNGP